MKHLTVAILLAVVLAGSAVAFFVYSPAPSSLHQGSATSTTPNAVRQPPTGWTTYRSAEYGFSFWYPSELSVKEYDEGKNSRTLTFEEKNGEKGFQIFITPYTEDHITTERFRMDSPSGVMENPVDVVIGGTEKGTMFFGKHASLGDTREVWFIYRGFLYEVTTYKNLDAWLSEIMATWTFI